MSTWVVVLIVVAVIALIVWGIFSMVHALQEYERGVVFRLGRVRRGPRARACSSSCRWDRSDGEGDHPEVALVPPQDVITKDNVTFRVDAVVYVKVVQPVPAVVEGAELPVRGQPGRPA